MGGRLPPAAQAGAREGESPAVRVWRRLGGGREIQCKKRVNFPSTFLAEDTALISGGYQVMR